MINARWWPRLRIIRTVSLVLLMLTGCGGSSGTQGGGEATSASTTNQLLIRLTPSSVREAGVLRGTTLPARTRQNGTARRVEVSASNATGVVGSTSCDLENPDPTRCRIIEQTATDVTLDIILTVQAARNTDLVVTVRIFDENNREILRGTNQVTIQGLPGAPQVVTVQLQRVGNLAPQAHAGRDQTAVVNQQVFLRGDGSTDVDGNLLRFTWAIVSAPAGSSATLLDATAVNPSFVPDRTGPYTLMLLVDDGLVSSAPAMVTVHVGDDDNPANAAPVADAGLAQTVAVGATVQLNGAASSDVDGDLLTFTWTLVNPQGSTTVLFDVHGVRPSFIADQAGTYTASLVVNDGERDSQPDQVVFSTVASQPVAHAGDDQAVGPGATVSLDGTRSFDPDGNPLTSFRWALLVVPTGSNAVLTNATTATPSFVVDIAGTYVAQIMVNDGTEDSQPDTVTITTDGAFPVADAGQEQQQQVGTLVMLNGQGSFDPDAEPLAFFWSLTVRPPGSNAQLNNAFDVVANFFPDVPGLYVAQLIVDDSLRDSEPDTTVIDVVGRATLGISLPANLNVALGQARSLPVTLGPNPAPPGGVLVTLASSNPALIEVVTPTVTIPAGAFAVNAQVRGVGMGAAQVTASSPGLAGGSTLVSSTGRLNLVLSPGSLNPSFQRSLAIRLSTSGNQPFAAPPGGLPVSLTAADPACVTLPSAVLILTGHVEVSTLLQPGSAGPCSTQITASAPNFAAQTFTISVDPTPDIVVNAGQPMVIGASLQAFFDLDLAVSNHGGTTVRLESMNPGLALLSPDFTTPTSASLNLFIPHGETFARFIIQGLAPGEVPLMVSAPNFVTATPTITVVPAAYALLNLPPTLDAADNEQFFQVVIGVPESAGSAFVVPQRVAPGETTLIADLRSSDAAVAQFSDFSNELTPSLSVPIAPGQVTASANLAPLAPGTTTVTVNIANQNTQPTTGATQQVTVTQPFLTVDASTVGAGLQIAQTLRLSGGNHGGTTLMLTSSDANVAVLSDNALTVGSATLTLTIPNFAQTATYFVQGVAPGTATLTAQESSQTPLFLDGTSTLTTVQPAIQLGTTFSNVTNVTPLARNMPLRAFIGLPDADNTSVPSPFAQSLSPALAPLTIRLTNSDAAVGQLATSAGAGQTATLLIAAGQSATPSGIQGGGAEFDPLALGSTDVSIAPLGGFIVTTNATQTFLVGRPALSPVNATFAVGLSLQTSTSQRPASQGAFTLNEANHGGVTVRVTSSDPNVVLLSTNPTQVGGAFVDLVVPNGLSNTFSTPYVVQGVGLGTATLTASAPGFVDGTSTVSVVQAGVTLSGQASTTTFGQNLTLQALVGVPNVTNPNNVFLTTTQDVRPGSPPFVATLTNTNGLVGQLMTATGVGQMATASIAPGSFNLPATIAAGGVGFDPFGNGTTTLSVAIPGVIATRQATQTVNVSTPTINLLSGSSIQVGAGLQTRSFTARLGAPNHGGVTLHLESSDPTVALLSPNASTPGSAALDIFIPNGSTDATYIVQGVENRPGSVLLSASAPGFLDATSVLLVVMPALQFNALPPVALPNTTTPFQLRVGVESDDFEDIFDPQSVRAGGSPLAVTVTSSNPSVGLLMTNTTPGATVTVQIPVQQNSSPDVLFLAVESGSTRITATSSPGVIGTTEEVDVQ